MKPKIRCMRYGEDKISPTKPAAIITSKPPNHLPFMPPRNRIPVAIAVITTKAPKSGSRSKSQPTTSITANMLAARNSACSSRKYADFPPVNLLASAIAIEEEYTITIPNVSRRRAAHSTLLSYSARGARPGLMLRSIDDSFHRQAKHFSPMPVVTEHVEARAGGRKEHRIARARRLRGQRHRLVHGCGASDRDACACHRRFDQQRVAADQHHFARRARDRLLQGRKVLPLAIAPGDENQF